MAGITRFITTKLKVNEQKSAVARPWARAFLSYCESGTQAANRAESGGPVQREGSGANAADGSAHGPWRLASGPALAKALPKAYFDSLGIPRLTAGR